MYKLLSPISMFGLGLITVNVIAFFLMYLSGDLIGDVGGFPVLREDILIIATLTVVFIYFFYLFPLFHFINKLKVKRFFKPLSGDSERLASYLIFALQVLFLYFSLANGVNVSGAGNKTTSSVFSYFWVFVAPDLLFILYYGAYRDSKLFKVNLSAALISGLLRGRADIFMFVIFMEISRLYITRSISMKKIVLCFSAVVVMYPFLLVGKFAFRIYFGGDSSDLVEGASLIYEAKNSEGNMFYSGFEHIISRLQIVSIVSEIYRLNSTLQGIYYDSGFFPYWKEGLHGIIYDAIMGHPRNMPLGTAFTGVGNFSWNFEVGDWNTNPGLAGWFLLLPLHTAMIFIYSIMLCTLSYFLNKQLSDKALSRYSLWYTWAFFLMPGWLGVFVLFILSQFVFLAIQMVARSFSK